MEFYRYIYISQAAYPLDSTELENILISARDFNKEKEITGMLLHRSSSFIQLLEGNKDTIYELMENRIALDNRHHSIFVVKEAIAQNRSFKNWSMGFCNMDNIEPSSLKGYTKFIDEGFTKELVTADIDVTHRLLLSFREDDNHASVA